ncbi:chloride channel protein [Paraburkholderia dilworthii]|uniref:chloride channel protein n=1 Tax=Paraburkholderia dilworthii TaxID=948106 RepID=UPI00040C4EE3|nr:chloride channel protein [Paraburkholderia dilworthii]
MTAGQRITLVAAGAGASIAATFNTLIGGVLFAIELTMPETSCAEDGFGKIPGRYRSHALRLYQAEAVELEMLEVQVWAEEMDVQTWLIGL